MSLVNSLQVLVNRLSLLQNGSPRLQLLVSLHLQILKKVSLLFHYEFNQINLIHASRTVPWKLTSNYIQIFNLNFKI